MRLHKEIPFPCLSDAADNGCALERHVRLHKEILFPSLSDATVNGCVVLGI